MSPRGLHNIAAAAALTLLAPRAVAAVAPAPILVDLNTGNGPIIGSDPGKFARLTATQTVFSAYDPVHRRELWISDGSVAGTHLLADICPGACSSAPSPLNRDNAVALGVLYLSADDGANGAELWKVTSAGVVTLVKDINPGAAGSNPGGPMAFMSSAPTVGYFSANKANSGFELWKTDGTAAGTTLVKDVNSGASGSFPCCFGAGLNHFYFTASEPNAGREAYVSDGTTAGTALRADINPGPGDSSPGNYIQLLNDTMVFTANDGTTGSELWITTASSTTQLKDIVAGSDSSFPTNLVGFAGHIFFAAYGGSLSTDNELWSTDGTGAGTAQFKDICSGSCSSRPSALTTFTTAAGARLLFFAIPAAANYSLFVSDGTVAGTVPIFSLGASVSGFTVSGSLAYFIDVTNNRLYRTDGTAGGTIVVKDLGAAGMTTNRIMGAVGTNKVIMAVDDGFVGNEPYVAGPNAGNFSLLTDIAPDLGYSDPQELTDVNGTLYFSAFSETTGRELWKVSDPNAGAQLVADIIPGAGGSDPYDLVAFNGKLYFAAAVAAQLYPQIYVTDGTAAGTKALKDLGSGTILEYLSCITAVGNRLYFYANGPGDNSFAPWVSDGTDAGTQDLGSGTLGTVEFCARGEPGFAAAGTKVLFQTSDSTHGRELFRTDGTAAGTALVRDIVPGGDGSAPKDFVSLGNQACFSVGQGGQDGFDDVEPWCSDGTAQGTLPLGDLNPGTDSSLPLSFARVGGYVGFSAFSPTLGRRVWRSDGTSAGTFAFGSGALNSVVRDYLTEDSTGATPDPPPFQHDGNLIYFPCTFSLSGPGLCTQDIRPGFESNSLLIQFASSAIDELRVFPGGDALMGCDTQASGRELCRFRSGPVDAQAALVDIAPGAASSSPDQITPSGNYIYFTADDGTRGRELWAVRLQDTLDRIFHDGFD